MIAVIAAFSASMYVVDAATSNRWWRYCIALPLLYMLVSIDRRVMVHYARPYRRQLRERDG